MRELVSLDYWISSDLKPTDKGLLVIAVGDEKTPAGRAKLRQGDLVVSVNEEQVSKAVSVEKIVNTALADTPRRDVRLMVRRGLQTVPVTIRPPQGR